MSVAYAERPGTRPYRNDLTFKPYVYRGKGYDQLTPELGDPFDEVPQRPAGQPPCYCGENKRGYRKHLAASEEPCTLSRDDMNLYSRERMRAKGGERRGRKGQRDLAPCGTEAAYRRHRRRGEDTCEPCRQANARKAAGRKEADNARRRERYAQARAEGLSPRQASHVRARKAAS